MSTEVAKTTKAAAKPKLPAAHPKYSEMVQTAVSTLKERGGSSRQAVLKYIIENFKVGDEKVVNTHLKMALRAGVKNGNLKQSKGTGASGSFRLGDEAKKAAAPKKVKKPKAIAPKLKPVAKPKTVKTPKKDAKIKKAAKTPAKKAPLKQPKNKAVTKTKAASKTKAVSTPKPKKTASKK